jgi:hypothetical protein
MKMAVAVTPQIAAALNLSEDELLEQAFSSLLRDKKRLVLQTRLEILARYGAHTVPELESFIAGGVVPEHPAWEDLIVAENLGARLSELDAQLDNLQRAR